MQFLLFLVIERADERRHDYPAKPDSNGYHRYTGQDLREFFQIASQRSPSPVC